jgi:hypothetical protein
MRDRETGTIWQHLDGRAIRGPLDGRQLDMEPMLQIDWGSWNQDHPETEVISPDTDFRDRYRTRQIGHLGFDESFFGDDRMAPNALVVGVKVGDSYSGFHIPSLTAEGGVRNAEVAGDSVVVAYDAATGTGIAYDRRINGQISEFVAAQTDGRLLLQDVATGTRWNLEGIGISGPLSAERLQFVPSIISEWYGWSAYHPETELYADPAHPEVG